MADGAAAPARRPLPAGFWLVLASQGTSLAGNGIQLIALPLWVLHETGSVLSTGIAFAVQFIPIVVLAPWVGHIADRFERRGLMIVCELLSAVAVVGLIGAVHIGSVMLVYALTALTHAFNAVTMPAMQAIVISLVPREDRSRSASLMEAMQAAGNILAPLAGTLLAATWGIDAALWANLATFVVSAALLIPLTAVPGQSDLRGGARSTLRAVRANLANRVLVWTVGTEAAYFLLFGADIALALLIAQERIGDGLAGIVSTGAAIGWLITSILIARRNTRRPLWLIRMGALACPVAAVAFVAVDGMGPAALLIAAVLLGGVNIAVVSGASTVFQQNVDATEAGRIFAVRRAVLNGMLSLSYVLLLGVSQAGLGHRVTLLVSAGLTCVAVLGGISMASAAAARQRHDDDGLPIAGGPPTSDAVEA